MPGFPNRGGNETAIRSVFKILRHRIEIKEKELQRAVFCGRQIVQPLDIAGYEGRRVIFGRRKKFFGTVIDV